MTSPAPLHGYRIIDLTTVVLGPYATQILGDLGAEIIKVEAPGGDIIRQSGLAPSPEFGSVFMNLNRNKRSIALDLKKPEAAAVLQTLLTQADVFVHNIRPEAMTRLGFTYDVVNAWRPEIIYASIVGYGSHGPYAGRPGYDDLMQAVSGAASLLSRMDGNPDMRYFPTLISDKTTGLHVVYAVLAALLHRERTGRGQFVEIPMFETTVAFLMTEHMGGHVWRPPLGETGYSRMLHPFNRPFKTQDGFLGILPYTDREWQAIFTLGERPDLLDDPRLADMVTRRAHMGDLYALVEEITVTKPTAVWVKLLTKYKIPFIHVNDIDTILEDEHLIATGFFEQREHSSQGAYQSMRHPVEFSDSPATGTRHEPPSIGANGREILQEAGYSESQIEALVAVGALQID